MDDVELLMARHAQLLDEVRFTHRSQNAINRILEVEREIYLLGVDADWIFWS